ncbi:WD repeat-containing protein 81 isoform X2 [Anoplophora glabripennis]|uniref:WD repeat-containing protein 81 isoform X2 n=1 Tax=Anoplophora glabripennis TaxID=217634 RepID=UPI0008755E4D|nr:WD repeat-containing protein 81 isoform X2 [Anoplophora glabripennis]
MENIFEELGIPKKYLKKSCTEDRYVALVHKLWLKSLVKHLRLTEFIEKSRLDAWPNTDDEVGLSWIKVFVTVLKKRDSKVIPLPKIRPSTKEENALMFSQLMQYISQTNYKNLWKEAYKKYSFTSEPSKETQVILVDYNDVLKDIITRLYGCPIVNTCNPESSTESSKYFDVNLNILPSVCAVETLNAIFLIHVPYFEHNLRDCVTFSPAILDKCYSKPLFIVFQLLNILKSLHDRSLTLGDVNLSDIYMTEDMWIYIFPQISSNIYVQNLPQFETKNANMIQDCRKLGHKFDNTFKCEWCGLRTYDKIQINNESLEDLCQLWIDGQISNFTYISALNKLSGRKLGDPSCHYVFPWVTDFSSHCGKNWRDLKKSKYRLNKGDRQLDLTYNNSQTQVPHHVSDVLSPITYYVYMARRTPKSVLCKNVRTIWVPAEYPSSIQRMQEWTPDECVPEFYTDPSVFRSIHDDLDDLEVPPWASGPEHFIERHRELLESPHVSDKLHYWIDLTFGYKLTGNAAVKSKNVCLHLADDHTYLTKSGLVQLFSHPHPSKSVSSPFWAKTPPKIFIHKPVKDRARDRSSSSVTVQETSKSDEDEHIADDLAANFFLNRSSLDLTKLLSRSRSSLHEEQGSKPSRSPSNQRSSSVGPKNPSFTSHVVQKPKPNQLCVPSSSLSTGTIYLPKEYKPEQALDLLEKKHAFIAKMFHPEQGKVYSSVPDEMLVKDIEECVVQNAFTNFIYSENFRENFRAKPKATKSHTFPLDSHDVFLQSYQRLPSQKSENQIICNYAGIISTRRTRELQVLGCLVVEVFMAKQLRAMGANNSNLPFNKRLKSCLTVLKSCKSDVPLCVSYLIDLLLQPEKTDLKNFAYPVVTDLGLPPPSAHLLLEPLLNCIIPFSKHFPHLYALIYTLKDFQNVAMELNILYHFDCNGEMCSEYENLERTKILLAQNIAECKVKSCAKHLESLLGELNTNTDYEVVNILLPHIKDLIEDPPTSVLSAWYLFEHVSRVLGPRKTAESLLESILKLYENEPNDAHLPYNGKIAKLYHHSFLLRLMVRLGLRCFLDNFITPLVEAVGGYKDYDKTEVFLHSHSEKVSKRTSHLKTMDSEHMDASVSDDSSASEKQSSIVVAKKEVKPSSDEEVQFEFDEDKEDDQMKSLIEQLELNVASDLPFNHSTAEEALDATIAENIDQLRNIEELNLQLNDDIVDIRSGIVSPTIPIPSSYHHNVMNISCEIGSKKSESDSFLEKKSVNSQEFNADSSNSSVVSSTQKLGSKTKKSDTKISEMSSDSVVWLSHRLGPVLTARYLSRNLLKMLTLCYVGRENLAPLSVEEIEDVSDISVTSSHILGDRNAAKVMECLSSIAALYGEQLILFQYIPHMSELILLCKRKLTLNLEGGLISCLALLKHIIPYLSDAMLMDQLQDVILKNILHPTVRLLGSTKYTFPSGHIARNILARKYLDALYILSIRMGSDMTKKYLAVPALQRFFLIFDKVYVNDELKYLEEKGPEKDKDVTKVTEGSHFVELRRDGTTTEWAVGGRPVQISHVRLKDSESADSLSPPVPSEVVAVLAQESTINLALDELRLVFTPELAHAAYIPFLRHVGADSLEISLKNHDNIRDLCQNYEQEIRAPPNLVPRLTSDFNRSKTITTSSSIGSNIAVIGNRIDVQTENFDSLNSDLLSLVSSRMENTTRHLRGNWLAYWEHEIGRSEKDNMFNFKQIKLQTFAGHTHSVKCLYVLDNENSFMSGSRDKTVKLWSLRSQGDGFSTSNCQWTYSAHKKSILTITFIESMRLVASCDSVVHIWDPFMGANLGNLESTRFSPVNVLKSMPAPSTLVFAATTDGTVKVIDARLLNYIQELRISLNPSGFIRSLAISRSGLWIAAGQSSGNITVLDTRTGLVISNWRAHESEVLQVVAVDNNTLVSSSLDQTISVWNIWDGKFKFYMRGATEPVHCLNVYNNELISGTTANRVGVHTSIDLDASFSSTKLRSDAFKGLLTSMAVLPLNRLLLLGADTGNINLLC